MGTNLVTCTGLLGTTSGTSILLPFTLGTWFVYDFDSKFLVTTTADLPTASASGLVSFTFQFLEADGTTPVGMTAVPEPGAFALLVMGLGAVCFVRTTVNG